MTPEELKLVEQLVSLLILNYPHLSPKTGEVLSSLFHRVNTKTAYRTSWCTFKDHSNIMIYIGSEGIEVDILEKTGATDYMTKGRFPFKHYMEIFQEKYKIKNLADKLQRGILLLI